jgi:superfamily II DNA or RNA helicase
MKTKLDKLKSLIHDKAIDIQKQQEELHNAYKDLSKEEMLKLLLKRDEDIKNKDIIIAELESTGTRKRNTKDIERYDIINFHKFNRTADGKILSSTPEHYVYNPFETAFEKNLKENKNFFRNYQKRFIEDWSLSVQELVILYYGVGSGKTMIAVNCAEQYQEITQDAHVYFLTPASLVLGTIKECYNRGIDPTRKNSKGEYIYYFISYQQLLLSNFDFKDNALLIIDEAHNLRNIKADEISEKVSARKYKATGNYSLVGNKLSTKLIESSSKFLRTIFMTGTLFVNGSQDIEALMAIGYKKQPMLNIDKGKYEIIMNSENEFKIYYEGLISYYRVPKVSTMPTKKFHFIPLLDKNLQFKPPYTNKKGNTFNEPYYLASRNQGIKQKIDWILNFLSEHGNKKTLIYSQFVGDALEELLIRLKNGGVKFGYISGKNTQGQKLDLVKDYNDNKINVMVFTLAIKEGISFSETNNIIMFQPYWNYAISEQILARGIRLFSHALQNKALINLYFLVAIHENAEKASKQWFKRADQIMNNDIKELKFPTENKDGIITKIRGEVDNSYSSGDILLYNRMFIKQEEINVFEEKLLALPRFEDVNNNENSEWVHDYKTALYEMENKTGKAPSIKETIDLKKKMYKDHYDKNIAQVSQRIVRFSEDTRYRTNRNPNLEEKASNENYGNKTKEIRDLIDKKATIDKFLELFNISKQDITLFQANFTPSNEVEIVIKNSGIQDDTRETIRILEPTAGIGNFVENLLNLDNKFNFLIDCNEYNNAFYQIGKTMYEKIDNIKWYNGDFWIFNNKYSYDYILGNPPFNLAHQVLVAVQPKGEKGKPPPEITFKKVDKRLYDVHFVSKSYNMLNDGGVLSMIISDRFLRQDEGAFQVFNIYLDELRQKDPSSVQIIKTGNFSEDKGVSKEMKTNFGMVNIVMKKLPFINIDLDNYKRVEKMISNNPIIKLVEEIKEVKPVEEIKSIKKPTIEIEKPKIRMNSF